MITSVWIHSNPQLIPIDRNRDNNLESKWLRQFGFIQTLKLRNDDKWYEMMQTIEMIEPI